MLLVDDEDARADVIWVATGCNTVFRRSPRAEEPTRFTSDRSTWLEELSGGTSRVTPGLLGVSECMIPECGALSQQVKRLADCNAKRVQETGKYVLMRKPNEENGCKGFVRHWLFL